MCEKPVDHQKRELNQNNITGSCRHIDVREEVPACVRKGVKVVKVHRCELCKRTFTYPSDLYAHTRIFHSKRKFLHSEVKAKNVSQSGKVYECKLCNTQIYRYKNFRHHSRQHDLPSFDTEWKDFYFL